LRNKYDALSGIATTQAFHGLLNSNCPFSHSNNFVFDKDGTAAERGCCPRLLEGGASSGGALGSSVPIERGVPNGGG